MPGMELDSGTIRSSPCSLSCSTVHGAITPVKAEKKHIHLLLVQLPARSRTQHLQSSIHSRDHLFLSFTSSSTVPLVLPRQLTIEFHWPRGCEKASHRPVGCGDEWEDGRSRWKRRADQASSAVPGKSVTRGLPFGRGPERGLTALIPPPASVVAGSCVRLPITNQRFMPPETCSSSEHNR